MILIFVAFVMPRFSTNDSRLFLYSFVDLNQLFSLSELAVKQTIVSIKKGNVGRNGKTAPTAPIPRLIHPTITRNIFLTVILSS